MKRKKLPKKVMRTEKKTVKKIARRTARKIARKIAKKTVKKNARKAAKRVAKNVVIPKKVGMRLQKLVVPAEDRMFLLKSGRKLRSMYDLVKALEKMSDDVFSYHVTPYKNDFSAWIYHVFSEVELARLLANEKNKKQTLVIIKEYFRK